MDNIIEIRLKNNLAEIEKVSKIIEELGESHNLSMKVVMDMNLAADEIITNIISYGYEDIDEHIIIVRIYFKENYIIAEVEDDAKLFNPLSIPDADTSTSLEEKSIGGLGIHLVRNLMDKLEYIDSGNKNILLFGKEIK